ncbi:hypothetical protein [Methanocella conradii]|uniref:hypothetical protein n=1 Tax=Methanocella conradii TaxID=1175444 RepID=UPI00157BE266|nr:hypothetical protein [Methanocella conradii]
MGERHERSVRSAALTMLGYIKEIRSLMSAGDEFHSSVNGRPTALEKEEMEKALRGMERAIEDYWDAARLPYEEKDVKWRIYVLAQFMEDLVYDMRPEQMGKTHGRIESEEQAERLERLCERLEEHIRRLKELSSK